MSQYQKGKTNLDFTEARDSEWQWNPQAIRNSALRSRQITTLAPHRSVFYRPDALPAAQPTHYSLHNAVKKFLTPCKGCSAYLPNDGELYVPLELAATLADFTHDVAMAVARRASTIHSNNYMAHSQIKKVVGVRRLYKD